LHHAARRGALLRLGAEGDPGASGDRAAIESFRPGLLSLPELRPCALDAGGRDREGAARPLDGVVRWQAALRGLLAFAGGRTRSPHSGIRTRGTGLALAAVGA